MYVCVCVCVCVWILSKFSIGNMQDLISLYIVKWFHVLLIVIILFKS